MNFRNELAVCIYKSDPSKTLHREGLPELTPCGLAFTPWVGAMPGVIVNGEVPAYEPKCTVCFPPDETE